MGVCQEVREQLKCVCMTADGKTATARFIPKCSKSHSKCLNFENSSSQKLLISKLNVAV